MSLCVSGNIKTIAIADVLYVPDLKYNLLSVRSLAEKCLHVFFTSSLCLIQDQGELVASGTLYADLYRLDMASESTSTLSATGLLASVPTWHERLVHIEPAAILSMRKNQVVTGLDVSNDSQKESVCSACIIGKASRSPFPKQSSSRTHDILELVHSGVNGPINVASQG